MKTLNQAIANRITIRRAEVREERRQLEEKQRADEERREHAVQSFRLWLKKEYDLDASDLWICADKYTNDENVFSMTVRFDRNGTKVSCRAPFDPDNGVIIGIRCPAIWHAVRADYEMDYENFIDAVIYAQNIQWQEID